MSLSILEREAIRARWTLYKHRLGITDPAELNFGIDTLDRDIAESSVRLLILPCDPEDQFIEFNEDFWEWWLQPRLDPATEQPLRWLLEHFPTSSSVISSSRNNDDKLKRFLALHRCGALEMELGSSGVINARSGVKYFLLVTIIARLWFAFALFRDVVDKFKLEGPYELNLALIGTRNAALGNVSAGWGEPMSGMADSTIRRENGLLYRLELDAWPNTDQLQQLAFRFGDWIEDTWCVRERRYISQEQNTMGQFISHNYRPNP